MPVFDYDFSNLTEDQLYRLIFLEVIGQTIGRPPALEDEYQRLMANVATYQVTVN